MKRTSVVSLLECVHAPTSQTPARPSLLDFLQGIALEEYLDTLSAEGIDMDLMESRTLTDADLKEIGILKLGHRKKLLNAINDL